MRIEFYEIDGEVQVWLEHDDQFSGLCIGFGPTRKDAADCAAAFLRRKADMVLQAVATSTETSIDGITR